MNTTTLNYLINNNDLKTFLTLSKEDQEIVSQARIADFMAKRTAKKASK
jgi:hypothetical protein